jgi:predicted ATPase
MKIEKLRISGFKCFDEVTFELSDVTLVSGLNSSGKSSLIQSLRMFNQAARGESPFLEGYGDFEELRSRFSLPGTPITISCDFGSDSVSILTVNADSNDTPARAPITYHLSAARHGPQSNLPLSRATHPWPELGSKGDYVVDFLNFFQEAIVHPSLARDKSAGVTVDLQINSWLQEIAPGAVISSNKDAKRDTSFYEINTFRPANAGFGVSYSLPILAALLSLTSYAPGNGWKTSREKAWEFARDVAGILLLIENPEAHLHPKAQTQLGRLIALASKCGVQIIVETQSDYILDGLRIAVKEGGVPAESVKIYYLKNAGDAPPEILTPRVFPDGRLEFWPDGFFDQTLKNRMQLAG